MKFKGTKGKWNVVSGFIEDEKGNMICSVSNKPKYPSESNAKLIAAAPELLGEHLMDLQHLKTWRKQLIDAGLRGSTMFQEYQDMIKAKEAVIEKALK